MSGIDHLEHFFSESLSLKLPKHIERKLMVLYYHTTGMKVIVSWARSARKYISENSVTIDVLMSHCLVVLSKLTVIHKWSDAHLAKHFK